MLLRATPELLKNTQMHLGPLAILLERALQSLVSSGVDFTWALYNANNNKEGADPAACDLVAALREVSELRLFDGRFQITPNQAMRIQYYQLGNWLLQQAKKTSVRQVIEDLTTFIQSTEIPMQHMSAVEGLRIHKMCNVDQNIRLLPWSELSETPYNRHVRQFLEQQLRFPSAALIHDFAFPKEQIFAEDTESSPVLELQLETTDILLCVGLFGPVAPVRLASWTEFPTWVPRLNVGYSFSGPTETSNEACWPEEAYSDFPAFYRRYRALSKNERDYFHVSLDRLNKAMRRLFPVDAAIDLGIALESLFLSDLSDDRGELSFRLRLRGARYLGHDSRERKDLSKRLRDLYVLRSKSVHTGRLSDTIEGTPVRDLLQGGYKITAAALRSMIENGQPDWEDIVFS